MSKKTRARSSKNRDGLVAGAGCVGLAIVLLLNLAWMSLVGWGIYELIRFLQRH